MQLMLRMTVTLLFWLLFLFVLVVARNFLYPIALGILFSMLLLPVSGRLERWGVTRILANIISIVLGMGAVYGILAFMYRQLSTLVRELPNIKESAVLNIRALIEGGAARSGIRVTPADEEAIFQRLEDVITLTGESLNSVISATGNTVLAIGLMPIYVFMFLYYRDKFARFILMLVPEDSQDLGRTILSKVARVATRYMTGMFAVVLILAVLNSVGLLIIGLEYAILFGVIAAICNFIPYFGTIIGFAFPFVFAFLTGNGTDNALGVLVLFFIIQFSENNIITPNIVGGMLRINPFFIILGVLGGGMLWGLPGMFVVVPVLAMFKVTCDHIPELKPWGFLISDRGMERHSITARKIKRFFAFSKLARQEVVQADKP